MGDAAYRDDWDGRLHEAETRIVECNPKALWQQQVWGRPPCRGSRRLRAATGGLIAAPLDPR
jgi:hypothetical protein